jgi:CheY-like chemotaxis protein
MPGSVAESSSVAVPSVVRNARFRNSVDCGRSRINSRDGAADTDKSWLSCTLRSGGLRSVAALRINAPQIAVLDVVMPRLGRTATADRLLVRFPELRVIFTRGYSRDRDERTGNLSQASYLQKPYSRTRLGRLVRDILDGETNLRVRDMVRVTARARIAASRRVAGDATLKRASAPGT